MKKILLYNSGGGLGDTIQLFPLIISLKNHFKDTKFYYLGAHQNHFQGKLKEFNINIDTFDLGFRYFGFRWWHLFLVKKRFRDRNFDKFDLIIDLQSKLRNTIILSKIPHVHFYSSTYNYRFCTNKKKYHSSHLSNIKIFFDLDIKELNYDLNNIPEKYKLEAKRLLPDKNYIGFSLTQGNEYRKKNWSLDNFINLASKINELNKVPVFFIEPNKINLIKRIKSKLPKALFPELHSNMSCPALVTALATRLSLAISIDNGVMHMMGLAKIPMIVLFGPTSSEKFAPKINSVKILDSKKIYKSKDIDAITVHDVYKLI
jgi:ADP-heptose:LPS heptosyltransferase